MNTNFENDDAEGENLSEGYPEKRKRGSNFSERRIDRWARVLIPIIVALIGAFALVVASGNGQVVVNIVNTIFGRPTEVDEAIIRTQVALELTQTKISSTQTTSSLETQKPPTLQPIATVTPINWDFFSEDFSDGLADGFSINGFTVQDIDGNPAYCGTAAIDGSATTFGSARRNQSLQMRVMVRRKGQPSWWIQLGLRADGKWEQGYSAFVNNNGLSFSRVTEGDKFRMFGSQEKILDENVWYTLRIDAIEDQISFFFNGEQFGQTAPDTLIGEGYSAFGGGNGVKVAKLRPSAILLRKD